MTQMGHNSGNWNTPMNIPCPECYVSPSTPFPGVATSLWLPVRLMHLRTKNKGATTPMVSIFSIIFPIWWPAIQGKNLPFSDYTHIIRRKDPNENHPLIPRGQTGSPGSKYNWLLGFGRFGMQPHLSCRMPNLCGRYLPPMGISPALYTLWLFNIAMENHHF